MGFYAQNETTVKIESVFNWQEFSGGQLKTNI